jgi:hydrogenase maturation protease
LTITERTPPQVRIVGVGNLLRRDEGVGVHAVRRLEELGVPDGVDLVDGGTGGGALLPFFRDGVPVYVIDAALLGLPPGRWRRIEWDGVSHDSSLQRSAHEETLASTLLLAEQLEGSRPDVVVFAVEPKDLGWGTELSTEVSSGLSEVVAALIEELGKRCADLGACGTTPPSQNRG